MDPVIEKCEQKESDSAETIKVQQMIHTDDNPGKSPGSLFLDKFKFGATDLNESQKTQAGSLVLKWKHVFAESDLDLGWRKAVQQEINLTDNQPFKERYRRIPPNMYQEVRQHLQEMLDCNVIQVSKSPFASPVVLARKKDSSLRFCIDYRNLNRHTIKDAHSLPRIEESLDALSGACWFSSLDLKAGYQQVEVKGH